MAFWEPFCIKFKNEAFRYVNERACKVEMKCERRGRFKKSIAHWLFDAQKNFVNLQGKGILSNLTLEKESAGELLTQSFVKSMLWEKCVQLFRENVSIEIFRL